MKEIDGIYYGYSQEAVLGTDADDLTIFNAVDTGKQYRAYNGHWFVQPVVWSDDPGSSSGGGGSGGSGGSATVVEMTVDNDGDYTSTVKTGPLWEAVTTGPVVFVVKANGYVISVCSLNCAIYDDIDGYRFDVNYGAGPTVVLRGSTADDYPTSASDDPEIS